MQPAEITKPVYRPRDYQTEAVASVYNYFKKNPEGNPVIAMPTGTGKSVVIAEFAKSVFKSWPNQKIMVVTHVKELVKQNYEKLLMAWPFAPAGIYSAGLRQRDTRSSIIFAGIASVAKRWAEFGRVDLVLIDEAHLLGPGDDTLYQSFLAGLKSINPYLRVIGLTATPYRLGHGPIADGELFHGLCFDITNLHSFNRLIAEDYLAPLVPKNTKLALDVDGVHMRAGDFNANELQIAVDKYEITKAALSEAFSVASDRRHWLIFASGVDHAEHISEIMETTFGVLCPAVHSKMPSSQRDEAIEGFKNGKYRAIVNNNILTTGFDSPWVDCIVCLRPTASVVLWVQMLGRGTRPFKGNETDPYVKTNCLALDFAGNTRRLGPINDPVLPKKKGEGGGEAPVKCCDVCDTWNHASVRFCVVCGNEFVFAVKITHEASTTDIIKGDIPITEVFKVETITYRQHLKIGRPPMIKVGYHSPFQVFNEYVCIEHPHPARNRAKRWWRERTENPMPATTAEALDIIDQLPAPTHLRVWINKQDRPEIMAYCFDGTGFGAHAPIEDLPSVAADRSVSVNPFQKKPEMANLDDDIPF